MNEARYFLHQQKPGDSPWSIRARVGMLVFDYVWMILCVWTPKPANAWRLFILRMFGTRIEGRPFVHQRARVHTPWNVVLRDRACIGDRANLYSLGRIEIDAGATIAQEAYLCAGTHAFDQPSRHLITAPITVGPEAFVGARAFVMPGVVIGAGAVVGACSVVTRDVEASTTVAGNPARAIPRRRQVAHAG